MGSVIQGGQTVGGDLSGTTNNATVTKINGTTPGALALLAVGNGLASSGGNLVLSGAQRVLGSLRSANMNTTADQAITIASTVTAWAPTAIWVTNASTNLTTAAGGVYPTTAKGGTPLVALTQVYTALTVATIVLPLTLAANIATTRYAVNTIYLALTSAQGGTATADIYIIGVDLT